MAVGISWDGTAKAGHRNPKVQCPAFHSTAVPRCERSAEVLLVGVGIRDADVLRGEVFLDAFETAFTAQA
ncbi:hypothetical protein AHiyo1_13260 [Arthrobacter sp. Hiyo1]|nr:hypothetical protein AHiyo1_13260 [Arthrobacter sp. Hiyo1]